MCIPRFVSPIVLLLLVASSWSSATQTCDDISYGICSEADTARKLISLLGSSDWETPSGSDSVVIILVTSDIDLSAEPFPAEPLQTQPGISFFVRGAQPDAGLKLKFWTPAGRTSIENHAILATGDLTFENLYIENAFLYDFASQTGDFISVRHVAPRKVDDATHRITVTYNTIRTPLTRDTFGAWDLSTAGQDTTKRLAPHDFLLQDMISTSERLAFFTIFGTFNETDFRTQSQSCEAPVWACDKNLWFEDRLVIAILPGFTATLADISGAALFSSSYLFKEFTIVFEGDQPTDLWPELPLESQQQQSCQTLKGTMRGQDYRGPANVSASGKACLPWRNIHLPGSGVDFSDMTSSGKASHQGYLDGNSCRNPAAHGAVWCFVESLPPEGTSGLPSWEYCDVPLCDEGRTDDCANPEDKGEAYRGPISVANNGRPCISWQDSMANRLFGFLSMDGSVCRNAGGDMDGPWCFVDHTSWRYCDIPECSPRPLGLSSGSPPTGSSSPAIIGGAIGAALVLLGTVLGAAVFWRRRFHSRSHKDDVSSSANSRQYFLKKSVSRTSSNQALNILEENDPVQAGEVTIDKRLGSGFTSTVWSGTWFGTPCAVKVMNVVNMPASLAKRLSESVEATLMGRVSHLHVVRIYKVYQVTQPVEDHISNSGVALASLWIVQEYCELGDIKTCNERDQVFGCKTEEQLLNTLIALRQVAMALRYLHKIDIVHGDLKRENVLLTYAPGRGNSTSFTAKVADFGMAHCMSGRSSYYASSAVFGDLAHMAPEVLRNSKISPSMDTFAFGTLIYEMVTGTAVRTTVDPHTPIASRVSWLRQAQDNPLYAVLEGLKALAEKCWQDEPDLRPNDEDVVAEIEAFLQADAMQTSGYAIECEASDGELHPQTSQQMFNGISDDLDAYTVPPLNAPGQS